MKSSSMPSLVLAAVLFQPCVAQGGVDESEAFATITTMTPMVRVRMKPDAEPVAATGDMKLPEGAQVITLSGGACELEFSRAHVVRLGPSTTMAIQRMPKKSAMRILVQLLAGRARAMVDRMRAESDFGMYASTTITAVKGTDYEMSRSSTGDVDVEVNEGKVDTAEMKSEDDLGEVEKAFGMLLLGQIGFRLIEGHSVHTSSGGRMSKPERMMRPSKPGRESVPKTRDRSSGTRERPDRGSSRDRTRPEKPDRGSKAKPDRKGGGGGGGIPSLPGGFGF